MHTGNKAVDLSPVTWPGMWGLQDFTHPLVLPHGESNCAHGSFHPALALQL